MTARDLQEAVLERVEGREHAVGGVAEALGLTRRALDALRSGDTAPVATELDHLVKHAVLGGYVTTPGPVGTIPASRGWNSPSTTCRRGTASPTGCGPPAPWRVRRSPGRWPRPSPSRRRTRGAAVRGAFVAAVEETGSRRPCRGRTYASTPRPGAARPAGPLRGARRRRRRARRGDQDVPAAPPRRAVRPRVAAARPGRSRTGG